MRIIEVVDTMNNGGVDQNPRWLAAWENVQEAIRVTDFPHGSGSFSFNPGQNRHENGVMPMKVPCMQRLVRLGWQTEQLPLVMAGAPMGNLDAILNTPEGTIGFEWETGNISSSHRAINKIILAIFNGGLLGGFLVVPSEDMRAALTDRIGNITELRPYFPVWNAVNFPRGILRIVVVRYDQIDRSVPFIPKQMDGNARRARERVETVADLIQGDRQQP